MWLSQAYGARSWRGGDGSARATALGLRGHLDIAQKAMRRVPGRLEYTANGIESSVSSICTRAMLANGPLNPSIANSPIHCRI